MVVGVSWAKILCHLGKGSLEYLSVNAARLDGPILETTLTNILLFRFYRTHILYIYVSLYTRSFSSVCQ